MSDFDRFFARHGEATVQAILENAERFFAQQPGDETMSLEERWNLFMQRAANNNQAA